MEFFVFPNYEQLSFLFILIENHYEISILQNAVAIDYHYQFIHDTKIVTLTTTINNQTANVFTFLPKITLLRLSNIQASEPMCSYLFVV